MTIDQAQRDRLRAWSDIAGPVGAEQSLQMRLGILQLLDEVERLEADVKDFESDRGCPVHGGEIHGGEAEELRKGIEKLIDGGEKVGRSALIRLLDRVDARDSLAHLEREDRVAALTAHIETLEAELRAGDTPHETSASIAAWQDETFGSATTTWDRVDLSDEAMRGAMWDAKVTIGNDPTAKRPNLSRAIRAAEELAELIALLVERDNDPRAVVEVADVQIVLAGIADAHGQEQSVMVDRKMAINRLRRWTVTGDGHGQHVDEVKP